MSLRQSLTLGSTLSTCWTCLFGFCWFYPSLIPQTNLHHRFWVLSFMDWMWQVAHLRKQSALLANTWGLGVGDKSTNQDLQEVNSLILQVSHSGWWEQELFPDPGWALKIISSIPFRWFFFQAREVFSHTHTQPSSVKIQENGIVQWSTEKTGCASCLRISLPHPGSTVLREIPCSTTDIDMPKVTGAIHHSTALFPGVETVSWDPRKNFLLCTWRSFEFDGCLRYLIYLYPLLPFENFRGCQKIHTHLKKGKNY